MRKGILIVVVVIAAALYFSGRMDHALYPLGLNYNTCARNGFGAVFCGSELTSYQQRVQGIQQTYTNEMRTITSSESAALQSITQQECQADPTAPGCP